MYLYADKKKKSVREEWRNYIAREVPRARSGVSPDVHAEIVEAIARYCEEESRHHALRSELIPQLFLRAAEQVSTIAPNRNDDGLNGERWIAGMPKEIKELIAFGWLSALSGQICNPGQNWLLDLRMLVREPDRTLEISILLALKNTIETIAPLWDSSCGHGVIALRGAQATARRIHPGQSPRASRLILEIRNYAEDLLGRIQRTRSWQYFPQVVVRDIY